jgi:hypothetical protein
MFKTRRMEKKKNKTGREFSIPSIIRRFITRLMHFHRVQVYQESQCNASYEKMSWKRV